MKSSGSWRGALRAALVTEMEQGVHSELANSAEKMSSCILSSHGMISGCFPKVVIANELSST